MYRKILQVSIPWKDQVHPFIHMVKSTFPGASQACSIDGSEAGISTIEGRDYFEACGGNQRVNCLACLKDTSRLTAAFPIDTHQVAASRFKVVIDRAPRNYYILWLYLSFVTT